MPFGLGFFATAGASAASAGSFDLLETQVLGSSTASVTFSSLSTYASTYKHLQLRVMAKNTAAVNYNVLEMVMRINGSTSNYRSHCLRGFSGSVTSFAPTLSTQMLVGQTVSNDSGVAQTFGASVIDILDPFDSSKNTTVRSLSGAGDSRSTLGPTDQISLWSGAWFDTTAVSSLTLYGAYGDGGTLSNFTANSRFSLYGVKGS
jgi:hypothetical protein